MFFRGGAAVGLLSVVPSADCVEMNEDRQLVVFGIGEVDLPVEFASEAPRWNSIPGVFNRRGVDRCQQLLTVQKAV
jgi:hypothetical protein